MSSMILTRKEGTMSRFSHYAVDINLSDGSEIRDDEFDTLKKARKYFDKICKAKKWKGDEVFDVCLVECRVDGDFEVLDSYENKEVEGGDDE